MEEQLKQKLMEYGVNLQGALERFMNNEGLYLKFLNKFPEEPTFARLEESMQKEDYPEAFRQAHTLKGVSANLGLDPLTASTELLVELLRNHESLTAEEAVQAKEYMKDITQKHLELLHIITAK